MSATEANVYSSIQVVLTIEARARIDTFCYIHDFNFSKISHFRSMTQPNPLKTKIYDPLPTQPAGQPNPRTTLTLHCSSVTTSQTCACLQTVVNIFQNATSANALA